MADILLGSPLRLTPPKRIELMSQGYWSGDGCRKGSPLARSVIVGGTFQPTPLAAVELGTFVSEQSTWEGP